MSLLSRFRGWWSGSAEGQIAKSPKLENTVPKIDRGNLGQVLNLALQEFAIEKSLSPQDMYPQALSGKARWSGFSSTLALERFRAVSWVYVCVKKTADALAQLPWAVEQQASDGSWEAVENSPLGELMNNPNEFWSRQSFTSRYISELLLTGNSLIVKIRPNQIPVELFTLRPQNIAPIPSRADYISGYEVKNQEGKKYTVSAGDVIHLQFVDPADIYWGLSPIRAAARIIDVENDSQSWQKASLQNMMVPAGIFRYNHPISLEQFQKEKNFLKEEYQGALQARKPLLLGSQQGPGPEFQQLALSPVDVDFIETRKLSREEICAIYGMPLPVAGILDRATYNNISTAKSMWWDDTLIPLIALVESSFNLHLATEFADNQRVRADTSKVFALLEQLDKRLALVERAWKMGAPFNEASEFFGLGFKFDGGDVGYIASNLFPVDGMTAPEEMQSIAEQEEMARSLNFDTFERELEGKGNGKLDRSEQLQQVFAPLRAQFEEIQNAN